MDFFKMLMSLLMLAIMAGTGAGTPSKCSALGACNSGSVVDGVYNPSAYGPLGTPEPAAAAPDAAGDGLANNQRVTTTLCWVDAEPCHLNALCCIEGYVCTPVGRNQFGTVVSQCKPAAVLTLQRRSDKCGEAGASCTVGSCCAGLSCGKSAKPNSWICRPDGDFPKDPETKELAGKQQCAKEGEPCLTPSDCCRDSYCDPPGTPGVGSTKPYSCSSKPVAIVSEGVPGRRSSPISAKILAARKNQKCRSPNTICDHDWDCCQLDCSPPLIGDPRLNAKICNAFGFHKKEKTKR